jgi:predicted RND superfamily exporter protein
VKSSPVFLKNVNLFYILSAVVALCTILFGLKSLSRLKTEYSVMQFLPVHHPALKMDRAVRKKFHIEDRPTFIGVLTLRKDISGDWFTPKRVKHLAEVTNLIRNMKGVENALSVGNVEGAASVDGALSVGELVKLVPAKEWNDRILNDHLLTPNLIADNARTVLIYVQLKSANASELSRIEAQLKLTLAQQFKEARTSVGGVPAIQTDLGLLLNKELVHFLLLTVLACAITLIMIFQTWSTLFVPLILTLYCNLMVFAMLALSGITFTVLSSTIPILVFIDVMTISCHILLRHYEESQHTSLRGWPLIKRTFQQIWLPNALGSLTTCVGFLTLLLSDVPLIRTYGLAVAVSIGLSSFFTSVGIIPLLLLFPAPVPRSWVHRPARWSLWIMKRKKSVLASSLALSCLFAFVGRNLSWTGRLFDDLPKNQEARISTEKIDHTMGGVVPLEIVVRVPKGADWVDPKRIQKLEKLVGTLRTTRGIGTALSVPDFLRVNGIGEGHLPKTRKAIAENYFLYAMSQTNPLNQYLTEDNRAVRIETRIHDLPSDQVQRLIWKIRHTVQKQFPDSIVQIGGMGAVVHTIHDELSHDLIFGFWQALVLIVVLLTFVFRSLRWALVSVIPNLIPPVILLGYLALSHTPIKPGVAIIFSIALGLAFTNTVYALNRMKELRKKGQNLPITRTFYLESNPCLVSTLVVMMGFSVFSFSYFEINRTFGECMIISILAGILGDLVVLPALLTWAPFLLEGSPPRLKKQDVESLRIAV